MMLILMGEKKSFFIQQTNFYSIRFTANSAVRRLNLECTAFVANVGVIILRVRTTKSTFGTDSRREDAILRNLIITSTKFLITKPSQMDNGPDFHDV